MKFATLLEQLRGSHPYATVEDIRKVFGDYHNVLHWLALFLIGDKKLADECVVDACTIAESQASLFHDWLVHWAARATVRCALQIKHVEIAELAPEYEKAEPVHTKHVPLTAEGFRQLIENSEELHRRLDVLCRFVLVLRGIAKDSCVQVAAQVGMSQTAVEQAYCVACETLNLAAKDRRESRPAEQQPPAWHLKSAGAQEFNSHQRRDL